MRRFSDRLASALLGALLCLAACAPTATVSVPPTATTIPTPTVTPTPVLAPTPTHVPAGWKVLATRYFSLAYPPDWTLQTYQEGPGSVSYHITPPTPQAPWVIVSVEDHLPDPYNVAPYCTPTSGDIQHTTLAGLPMAYMLNYHIRGMPLRDWTFVNAPGTLFTLDTNDTQSSSAIQAQDEAILGTFRPDNATPWSC